MRPIDLQHKQIIGSSLLKLPSITNNEHDLSNEL